LRQNSVYSKKSSIKYIPKEIQKAWFREATKEFPEFSNTANDWVFYEMLRQTINSKGIIIIIIGIIKIIY
jgi:hypothetical protein